MLLGQYILKEKTLKNKSARYAVSVAFITFVEQASW
jgi:hypothetical protein